MQDFIDATLAWISANRDWAPLIVFLLALGETTAFISILIPSTAILVGIGALVATGALDFAPLWVAASAGALVGSSFSYWIGRRFGPAVLVMWPMSRDPEMTERGMAAFAKWGPGAVLVGHFFGPLRAVAFLAAGMSAMRFAVFQLVNIPGALAWAFVIPKSGEIGGDVAGWLWRALTGG